MANNWASGSKLTHLLSTHDFKLVCAECSVKENEITYVLKSARHQCARNILIGKAKASDKWRPISRRPTFPNPSLYEVCWYFSEGSGCKKHKNRCTFARSDEEATVWNFEKSQGLNHTSFCQRVVQTETVAAELNTGKLDKPETLSDLLGILDLTAACSSCSVQEKEITYSLQSVSHCCGKDLLLAKVKGSDLWRPVSDQPRIRISKNSLYQVCIYFEEGSGCTKNGRKCTFARSMEEATVWNFERDEGIDTAELIRLVTESEKNAMQPEIIAENILNEFSGEFLEVCQCCFLGSPPKLTVKSSNSTCSSDAIHAWNPVLVHHVTHGQGKEVYSQVRPPPPNCRYEYCSHVQHGMPCWHGATQCHCAHSEVELAVWKAEESGSLIRAELLLLSQDRKVEPKQQVAIYCKACLLVLSSQESFLKHCASLEHAQMISEDTTIKWECRPPPHCSREQFSICDRPDTCEYGNSCVKAHSVVELEEWRMRAKEQQEIKLNIEAQGFMPYSEKLLEEYRNSSNEVYVMSDQVDDVTVMCDEELCVDCEQANASLHWNFHVNTERLLVHVALLKQEPGASFSLGEVSSMPCTYASGEQFKSADMTYDITVSFEALNPGIYDQWLVLDFDMRPVLLKKLKVRVGQPTPEGIEGPVTRGTSSQSLERWHRGNRVIIPCVNRREEQEELLKEYKPPQISFLYKPTNINQTPLSHENYKERMHQFLYEEERAEEKVVSRLNFCGDAIVSDTLQDMKAPHGELYCTVSVTCKLTPDTPEGSVLRRSVQSAFIAPLSSTGNQSKVYEAIVVRDTMTENKMHLLLSKRCCSELDLRNNETRQMEVQFQLNRLWFCKMHKAVDFLPDTKRVLPDFKICGVPVNDTSSYKVNAKQQAAINFIIGDSDVRKCVAPLLIYGPFGTGKTFTLATAARELSQQPDVRVLICTHTNSSADLYVKDHFHPFIKQGHHGLKPIRIKAKNLNATDAVTLKYCHLSKDGQHFLPPTKAVLDRHRIVITTTSMAQHFHDLKLPSGYFTHILIDEASQMLECEALIPLGLAGPNTRVVLAGDHMQMGPKLFSVEDDQRSNHTLLNRLFHFYQGKRSDAAMKSRIIFNANYRSTEEIVDFVSTQFYVGKNDAIKAVGKVPVHPDGHSLKFYHVRGECHMDKDSMSSYNTAEVAKVVEIVQDVVEHWPSVWGNKDHGSICVLSEGWQVQQIRKELSKKRLFGVKVENIANVQGKQFRAVIITAVQTRESLKSSHLPGVQLFNDPRVLNTAMTRAQSQVFVVGDAAALCTFGTCSRIWKTYIDHCINKESVEPNHLTKDFFERDINEISRFRRFEQPDDSDIHTDSILKELEDDIVTMETECSSDKFEPLKKDDSTYSITDAEKDNLRELCISHPNMFFSGRLVIESFDTGYVIPFDNPTKRVSLKGKRNLGKAFHGDEVVLQRTSCDSITQNKVVGVTKMAESSRVFVCTLEDEDHCKTRVKPEEKFIRKMMIPLARNAPKLCITVSKKDRNLIPVWGHRNSHWKIEKSVREEHIQNYVFLVEVVCWKEHCLFPLGKVIDVLPFGKTLDDGLRILDAEFRVESPTEYTEYSDEDARSETEWRHPCANIEDLHKVITFTVDPDNAKVLDDAISVKEFDDDHYEIGVHITDVASMVRPGDALDREAKRCGTTYYRPGRESISMFPQFFSKEWSLLPGHNRRVISLIFKVKKATDEIVGKPTFQLSLINSNEQLSYDVAEDIIKERSGREPKFDTVEDCVAMAYRFAKAQRRARLKDWAYARPDDHRLPGKRRAHLMIEEVSVLFNSWTSHVLINAKEETSNCTPLRCQAPPNPEKVEELKEMYGDLIPLSFHLKHRLLDCDHSDSEEVTVEDGFHVLDSDHSDSEEVAGEEGFHVLDSDHSDSEEIAGEEGFRVLTKVWHEILSAAQTESDIDKLVDLIATDDIHPQLLPAVTQFRKCFGKSYIIRSNSSPKADVGHCLLKLPSYTQASSPLRRFIDIILQRLLHTHVCGAPVQYSTGEIDILSERFEESIKTAKQYEQKAEMISFAVNMKKQNVSKVAFVVSADSEQESFRVSFPFDKSIFPDSLPIMYRDLQLEKQPWHERNATTLQWRRRIYSASKSTIKQIHNEVERMQNNSPCTEVPLSTWKAIVEAIDKSDWKRARLLIQHADTKQEGQLDVGEKLNSETSLCSSEEESETSLCSSEEEHYVDLSVQLASGDTLQVQMTSAIKRGQHTPTVQLVFIKPKFEICVDHAHDPIQCFSRYAYRPSKSTYRDAGEYIRVWKPMCEMESAATAVGESDSIVIEDLVVKWSQEHDTSLKGSFVLTLPCIEKWAIEFNLVKCFLCIRKRGLPLTATLDHTVEVDPADFTWVAHGVTYKMEDIECSNNKAKKVDFYVNHLPMENIPECVFQKETEFTVELVPKLLPDIRKEEAVINIDLACDLVKNLALGHHIPREVTPYAIDRRQLMRKEPPKGLPQLNKSQCDAVEKALKHNFTLIQGPPGTGKTVVGVYIVYWFLELNSKTKRKIVDPIDSNKKEVILYCGPSNKSVDVVAEYLLRFGDAVKPLRVYSQQVEMLDYPYPGCTLKFSRRSLRQECSKPELRSITLHHRIRQKENPHSEEIKSFDRRINKGSELSDEEVKAYKTLLSKARKHELERHDIILCTCTAASTPSLRSTVSARQILIDECAMATEPQALIPLVCNKPEKIVLLGDHKQLRPIVKNMHVRKLGMSKSLFERYFTLYRDRAVMLDTQYRMHEDICKFPSMEYYGGLLQTMVERPNSVFMVDKKPKSVIFGDVRGDEISQVVRTATGNENSKANLEERDIVVKFAKQLVEKSRIEQQSIVILSPYNAQVSQIKDCLKKMDKITVTTITKSQGSEWRYVIISTVRSLPSLEIEREPDRAWLSKQVGFVGDPNQINVGITRAKEGLCIVGNQELLNCSPAWRQLLKHYTANNSVTKAENISVRMVAR